MLDLLQSSEKRSSTEELIDILIAISVIARFLARKLQNEIQEKETK